MARVLKKAIYGSLPSSLGRRKDGTKAHKMTQTWCRDDSESSSSSSSSISSFDCSPRRREDYLRYEESSSDDDDDGSLYDESRRISRNFCDLVIQRGVWPEQSRVDPEFGARHMLINDNFRERAVRLGEMNKIFCSRWLNDRQVVFGSKCNKLSVYDTAKREIFSIPLLKPPKNRSGHRRQDHHSVAGQQHCGIHSMAINPSQTVLATGGENANDVAFYSLPTFDPLAVGEVNFSFICFL